MLVENFIEELNKQDINLKEMLEIRTYIPIAEKRVILETIVDRCFTIKDGVLTCDYILKKMMFELAMIKYHTNLEIDITSEEDYDEIQKTGIDFHCEYPMDYSECYLLFDGIEKELRSQYSIEISVAQLSNKLSDGIEDVVNKITQKIENSDMSKFGFDSIELNRFKKLLNKYGK